MHSEVRKNSDALAGLPPPLTAERRISADVDMDPCKAGRACSITSLEVFRISDENIGYLQMSSLFFLL